jgi:tryptophanyl-tRNA synthetase
MKTLETSRYKINVEEISEGGAAGYESTYLTSEGDPATPEMYEQLNSMDGTLLPAENKTIRQRNGSELLNSLREGLPVGIASGFKPSGAYHFGHKLTSSAVSFFQKNGAQIFVPVADIECDMDTRMSKEEYLYWAADNLLDWGANGVNLDAAHVYLQSEERRVNDLSYILARALTFDFAVDTYGFDKMHKEFPFLFAGITQVGDIVLPQHSDFGNQHSFMVSGQDQDGHMKMTVGLVEKTLESGMSLLGTQTVPSGFYIPHIRGLSGKKASSSKPKGTLYLGSGPNRLNLTDRINAVHNAIDETLADQELQLSVKKGMLDLVRYIGFFNDQSSINFGEALGNIPRVVQRALAESEDSSLRNEIIDNYLINECESRGQDNVSLVRDSIADALKEHQQKRQEVLEAALGGPTPEFWNVPERAVIDPTKRNKTEWKDLIKQAEGDLIV